MPDCIAARKQLNYIYRFHVSQQTIRRQEGTTADWMISVSSYGIIRSHHYQILNYDVEKKY